MNVETIKRTLAAFGEDNGSRIASAIAYTTILSIVPLFIVLIAFAGGLIGLANGGQGHHIVEEALLAQVRQGVGDQVAERVREIVTAALDRPRQNAIARIIGWGAFLMGAAGLFSTVQGALNSIWRVDRNKRPWQKLVKERAASFAMILVVGALILATVIANSALAVARAHFLAKLQLAGNPLMLEIVGQAIAFVAVTVGFALLYKVLPDASVGWRDVWVGAAATALLFVIGQVLIAWYLTAAAAGLGAMYGAAASLLVVLLWFYYSALIFVFGAEFTKVYAQHVEPQKGKIDAEPQSVSTKLS